MDYSKPPKFTIFSKTKARVVGTTLAVLIPATFFYYAFKSHFFHLNRAFSDIHMVTVNVVASDPVVSYALIELSNTETCAVIMELAASSSSVAHSVPASSAAAQFSKASSPANSTSSSGIASSVPEFTLPSALEPLVVAPQCLKGLTVPSVNLPEGRDGIMTLELTLNKSGLVYRVDVLASSGAEALDIATSEQLINNWQLSPCLKDGGAIECKRQVRVRWKPAVK